MSETLLALAIIFTQLSLLAFGGGNTVLPEMQRQVVDVHHWMSAADFGALFALARAAPGPNMMVVPLIGWHVAGWSGMLVASLAKFIPSSLLILFVLHLWQRFRDHPWRRHVQAGLLPVTIGLVAASALLLVQATATSWLLFAIALMVALFDVFTRVHPLWLLAAGALAGLLLGSG
ncbi:MULTISPECIES: chromate transporter [Pseudomonas]|uniref:chromate transporter n=1 Tax=Pseudomonas TaxID=286 RepID=UPI00249C684D|nr:MULTISPECIES: chromate transporter [Pseudomonas]